MAPHDVGRMPVVPPAPPPDTHWFIKGLSGIQDGLSDVQQGLASGVQDLLADGPPPPSPTLPPPPSQPPPSSPLLSHWSAIGQSHHATFEQLTDVSFDELGAFAAPHHPAFLARATPGLVYSARARVGAHGSA